MSRKKKSSDGLTPEDSALFRAAVKEVQPIRRPRTVSSPSPPLRPIRRNQPLALDTGTVEEDGEAFRRLRLPLKRFSQLKKGSIRPDSLIDLHGLTVAAAKRQLRQFIEDCSLAQERCVLVITGKGIHSEEGFSPLRTETLGALRELPQVQAYCWAQIRDGGSGAFYVLIQNPER